ncbi:TIGR04282 family arsenosugar biosynthesis glycosyltransferase [Methylogaea oryzae]|uniref:Glycosyltransferase n=1 Tax=Methylogaea oryzae TaxID=1295382 RepID=A0A8D4VNZ2_9GAMM|nr:TIGR04282 family arsenosugar biosynthesis glycosyltransferase [Methylogaea oryzae]BBL70024.1 hypothetical protein MoryE10_06300 [Methylogaea oryzae]
MNRGNPEAVAIAVFAKAPLPGHAKTRLIPVLGSQGAADLQRAFVLRTLETAVAAAVGPVSLWCAPDCSHELFGHCRERFGAALRPQTSGDLGQRMRAALAELCRQGPALLIGTDCPAMAPAHLRAAAAALRQGSDAVFLPAEDGGYVLVGVRRAEPWLFGDMPWGGSAVMAETRRRMRQAGWRWAEPALLWDVDRPEDWRRLERAGLMAVTPGGVDAASAAGAG